jgi:malate dehydrogenase (oxaloacetate-decarboxylating)
MDKNDIAKSSMELHKSLKGKLYIGEKVQLNYENLAELYTPGVAQPCLEIANDPLSVYDLTWKWNSVAVISDGSRVLGLGDIGPQASLPLLEGKALIFSRFGGLEAVPIPISQLSVEDSVAVIKSIQHGFGGINLEDISVPRCFDILDKLIEELDVPVWHDDQQGTATIIVAGLLNALEITGKDLFSINIVLLGAGAANSSVYRLLKVAGVEPSQMKVFDKDGILGSHRRDLLDVSVFNMMCTETNPSGNIMSVQEGLKGSDVVIALSKPGPGVIKPEWIRSMNKSPVVFACANPIPEIDPRLAKEAGAAVVATGRSDYPNQVNNALVFPGVFRGALDVRAKGISWGMSYDVAKEIAGIAKKKGLKSDYIVPKIDDPTLHISVAKACAMSAIREGLAGINYEEAELERLLARNIKKEVMPC